MQCKRELCFLNWLKHKTKQYCTIKTSKLVLMIVNLDSWNINNYIFNYWDHETIVLGDIDLPYYL